MPTAWSTCCVVAGPLLTPGCWLLPLPACHSLPLPACQSVCRFTFKLNSLPLGDKLCSHTTLCPSQAGNTKAGQFSGVEQVVSQSADAVQLSCPRHCCNAAWWNRLVDVLLFNQLEYPLGVAAGCYVTGWYRQGIVLRTVMIRVSCILRPKHPRRPSAWWPPHKHHKHFSYDQSRKMLFQWQSQIGHFTGRKRQL